MGESLISGASGQIPIGTNKQAIPTQNCTEGVDVKTIEFGRLSRRVVEGRFNGGSMTSEGRVTLLGAVDRMLDLI